MPVAEDKVREALKQVIDPELFVNIVDLGLIYDVAITPEKTAEVTMTLTSPGCPAGPEIITNVQRETHVAECVGAEKAGEDDRQDRRQ